MFICAILLILKPSLAPHSQRGKISYTSFTHMAPPDLTSHHVPIPQLPGTSGFLGTTQKMILIPLQLGTCSSLPTWGATTYSKTQVKCHSPQDFPRLN